MELKKFIENFAEQFDETDMIEFEGTTNFKNLEEWSSITALSIIAMVDEEYDKQLKGDDIMLSNTIEDLYNLILNK